MLKELISLFAEKFFYKKRAQVSTFASPKLETYFDVSTGFNGPNEWSDDITAPFDGWIRVEATSTAAILIDLSPYGCSLRQSAFRAPSGFISCVCRISKGARINYVIVTTGTISDRRVLLIPSGGS